MRWQRLSRIWGMLLVLASGLSLWAPLVRAEAPRAEPLDYTLLTHTITIDALRAGIHTASAINDYSFHVQMYGLLNQAEERNLEFSKRKKIAVDLGKFGETKIEPLAAWHPDAKTKEVKELRIEGTAIRELVAQVMNDFKVMEPSVMVQVDIEMQVRHKKYLVLGDDQTVAKTSYYPIPATQFEVGLRTNQSLLITDDKGADVRFSVTYEKPNTAKPKEAQKDKEKEPEKGKG